MARAISETADLRLVFIESPANPTLVMTDIARAAQEAQARRGGQRPLVAVDNTFLGPVFQQPLPLGADLSVYSATKYLAGQSDILAGVVMGKDATLIASLRGMRAILGNILQPDECWILDSRLPTVELRMTRQSKNAARIVAQLADHPQVKVLHYPDLFSDPEQVRIRDQQCRFPGAVFALDLKGGRSAAFDFLRRLRIARNAVSLGGVETLACHPRTTTHSEMSADELGRYGIGEGLVRISVGVEDYRDLLRDFQEALDAL
jgi:cystathionine beta-lyase/cystathionine gamma-synthase